MPMKEQTQKPMQESDREGKNSDAAAWILKFAELYFEDYLFPEGTKLQRFLRSGVNGRVAVPLFVAGTA